MVMSRQTIQKLAITAPSSTVTDNEAFRRGLETLAESGFRLTVGDSCRRPRTLTENDDKERAQELLHFLSDDSFCAVLCARGGYGAARLLPYISRRAWQQTKVPLYGFSDITALHAQLQSCGKRSYHAPMVCRELGNPEKNFQTLESFYAALLCDKAPKSLPCRRIRGQDTSGLLYGGNLTVLASLCGSPYAPCFHNGILLLEETGEALYRIDRCMTQLKQSGMLCPLRAVLLGDFDCIPPQERNDYFARFFADREDIALSYCNAIGHTYPNLTVRLGVSASLTEDMLIYT